jgi:hypothetical protein
MLKRVLAANGSWCREAPASISDTGSHAPMRAELGRASPFSSVVAANGHEISDDCGWRVGRAAHGQVLCE